MKDNKLLCPIFSLLCLSPLLFFLQLKAVRSRLFLGGGGGGSRAVIWLRRRSRGSVETRGAARGELTLNPQTNHLRAFFFFLCGLYYEHFKNCFGLFDTILVIASDLVHMEAFLGGNFGRRRRNVSS